MKAEMKAKLKSIDWIEFAVIGFCCAGSVGSVALGIVLMLYPGGLGGCCM